MLNAASTWTSTSNLALQQALILNLQIKAVAIARPKRKI
jgi:hypothetical protein